MPSTQGTDSDHPVPQALRIGGVQIRVLLPADKGSPFSMIIVVKLQSQVRRLAVLAAIAVPSVKLDKQNLRRKPDERFIF